MFLKMLLVGELLCFMYQYGSAMKKTVVLLGGVVRVYAKKLISVYCGCKIETFTCTLPENQAGEHAKHAYSCA